MSGATIAAWVALGIQAAAIVWGAATLAAAVGRLSKAAEKFEGTMGTMAERQATQDQKLAVALHRLDASESRLKRLEEFIFSHPGE